MNDCETKINTDITDEVTVKIDRTEIERTMRLSDEELHKAVQQVSKVSGAEKSDSGNTTSFFNLGRTSSFSTIFEKKRVIEDELAEKADETSIGSDNISDCYDHGTVLNSIEKSFDIISKIGEGGQGVVSTAADRSLGRIVALKSLHNAPDCKNNAREHFIAEAKITAQLDYPGIVPVYSLNSDNDGGLHLAMKFINGETLADYLDRVREQYAKEGIGKFNENHSMRKRIEIFLRVCDAVAYAHNRNVMHCDLKPENIMLGKYNDSYIMDWGISRLIQDPSYDPETWTKPAVISGTPRYLSPEAIDGVYTDERIDIYALGLILFECVFLKTAFNGKDTKEVIGRIRNGEIESFTHAFGCSVSKDLCAVIRKAVAYKRDDRYQSVSELADDIRCYMANEETQARPDNIFTKAMRFGQRHIKMLLIFALSGLLLAVASMSYSVYQQNKHVNFMLQRDIALSEAYSNVLHISSLIELQMNHVSSSLKTLSAYISFLLSNDNGGGVDNGKYFWYPDEQKRAPRAADITFSVPANKYITLDRMSFNHFSGKYTSDMAKRMNRLQVLQPFLRNSLLQGNVFMNNSSAEKFSSKEAKEHFIKYGSPKLWIYCGFEDGLYFSMPGYLDQPDKYDPRRREWYIAAAAKTPFDDVSWGTPYVDAVSRRLTLTASLPIFVDKKLQGVIAIDNMLQYISRFMKEHGNTENFLLEKSLIDSKGRILFSTSEDYSVMKDEKSVSADGTADKFFSDKAVFAEIAERRNGILTVDSDGRNIVYLFARIDTLGWQYIEKIDLDMLIEYIENKNKSKTVKKI